MTMVELYNKIGADYRMAQSRLGNDKVIERFVIRFTQDKTYERFIAAYEAGDEQAVFEEACNFVEVCGSLSLSRLAETGKVIMEAYRERNASGREKFHVEDLFDTLSEQYEDTIAEINNALGKS